MSYGAVKSTIARGGIGIRAAPMPANQGFIEFQTRAIFIFEQSRVGGRSARSGAGESGSSPLYAIRATVVRHTLHS